MGITEANAAKLEAGDDLTIEELFASSHECAEEMRDAVRELGVTRDMAQGKLKQFQRERARIVKQYAAEHGVSRNEASKRLTRSYLAMVASLESADDE